jgi:hypothetical protein
MKPHLPAFMLLIASVGLAGDVSGLAASEGQWAFVDGVTAIERAVPIDASWADGKSLTFRVRLSDETLHTVRLFVYLVGTDGLWYQSARALALERTRPETVTLDLRSDSGDWVPRGHLRAWDGAVTHHVEAVGLKAFSGGFEGSVIVDGVSLRRRPPAGRQPLCLLDFQAPDSVAVGECCEVRFRLDRGFDNPFDPSQVDVQALVAGPDGVARRVAGFFTQRYYNRWEGESARLAAAGAPEWRIRVWPRAVGRHECRIQIRTKAASASLPWPFEAVQGDAERASSACALTDGDFAKQLGAFEPDFVIRRDYNGLDPLYIYRSPQWRSDARTPPKGPIRAWRAPIEWTERWGGYGGLGRVSLAVASEFDDLLDRAAAKGIALPLALTDDEPFGDRAKYNWKDHPLNEANRGPLAAPSAFYTDETAWQHFTRLTRYILARWGDHPAVASWELWCTLPANGADRWHARAGDLLATWSAGTRDVRSHHPQTVPPVAPTIVNTFAKDETAARDRWMTHTVIKHTTRNIAPSSAHASHGSEALEIVADYPGEAAILRTVEQDWHAHDRLAFDVFVPKGAPNDMRVMIYLRDRDLWWYESLLPAYLRPGDWTKLLVDLSGETTKWEPRGHAKVFDRYALQRVRVLGIRVFGHRPYKGALYLDNIQLWRDPAGRVQRIKVLDLRPNAVNVPRFGRFELSFRLSKTYPNPFDPECVDVMAHFTDRKGRKAAIPAFFYQEYERHQVEGREFLTPKGLPCWKVRFTPSELGTYTYSVTLDGKRLPAISKHHFDCTPSKLKGFVRRSKADDRYFEHTSGEFFYPIGMNLRSPSDNRKPYDPLPYELPEGKGTYIYDEYYRKLAANGMNWARIWQCPWWCGLEWTREWPGYQGLGVYNLENAWRFDYCLDQAAAHGIYVQACLTNHGQITIEKEIDRQWDTNPLNAELGEGGPLKRAAEFYTNEAARKLFRQRLRYTAARWAYSPHLMGFALFSEMEFTELWWRDHEGKEDQEGYTRCPPMAKWVGEMAAYMKKVDPFGHLVTTHFSHPWSGEDIWQRSELDFIQSNAYSAFPQLQERGAPRAVETYYDRYMARFARLGNRMRPVLIAEFGGHWKRNPEGRLDAELHGGTWASVTSHLAGATGYWWWLHVHFRDRYAHYRAAANYMAGEDRRGLKLEQEHLRAVAPGTYLRARTLKNDQVAYVWVYHPSVARSLEGIPEVKGAKLDLPGMRKGSYTAEFWNTYTGERTGTAAVTTSGDRLRIELPPVQNDIALKVKPR